MDGYGYSLTLFFHLISLLAAGAASALAGYAAVRMRTAGHAPEIARWGMMIGKVVRVFPLATLGLLGTGAYMTERGWSWSTPWIVSGLIGLAAIVVLGFGVEGPRGRALKRELIAHGLSARARRLLSDPLAWTAKLMTWTLMLAVVFVMTIKPSAGGCGLALVGASLAAVFGAVPIWRVSAAPALPVSLTRDAS